MRNAAKADLPVSDALNFSVRLQWEYEARTTVRARKEKGQYFTPPEVSRFMAGLISLRQGGYRSYRPFRLTSRILRTPQGKRWNTAQVGGWNDGYAVTGLS